VLTHREQAPVVKAWIQKRFDTVLPALMQREKIDMWIIVSREYNDDPVFRSMAPLTTYSSRRRTILVFSQAAGRSSLSVGRFDMRNSSRSSSTPNDGQWAGSASWSRRRPEGHRHQRIGGGNHADGLTANEARLTEALARRFRAA
jgi:hypothetical protein